MLAAVAARVLPLPDADPPRIAQDVDQVIDGWVDENRSDFKQLLHLLENGLAGLLLDGRPHNFTRLESAEQDRAIEAFRDSKLVARRAGYHALRKLCAGAYYARETSWRSVGYPGPPVIPPDAFVTN